MQTELRVRLVALCLAFSHTTHVHAIRSPPPNDAAKAVASCHGQVAQANYPGAKPILVRIDARKICVD